jgi:hypothetical protein
VPTSGRLVFVVFNAMYLFMGFFHGSAVSSQQSALENTLAALIFVLGGLEVPFGGVLVMLFVVWLTGAGVVRVLWNGQDGFEERMRWGGECLTTWGTERIQKICIHTSRIQP